MAAPLTVSNARIEIMAKVFMATSSGSNVAKNVRGWRDSGTIPRKIVATRSPLHALRVIPLHFCKHAADAAIIDPPRESRD